MGVSISRTEAAQRLGCSQMQVVRFEQQGRLHPRREAGRVWLDGDEVAELARTWRRQRAKHLKLPAPMVISAMRAKVAPVAYALMKVGLSDVDVVIQTGADPALIAQLRESFETTPELKRAREREHAAAAKERAEQRAHERRRREDAYRKMQLEKARIEANARVQAAELELRAKRRTQGTS
jgi:hypothetical protein